MGIIGLNVKNMNEKDCRPMHTISSSDGREINNFLTDSLDVSVENFKKGVIESENNLPFQYITDLFDGFIIQENWIRKPTEVEVYFLGFIKDIKHDYIKSLQHLLQGFLSDHHMFVRRAVENCQYLLFLKEKLQTKQDFEKYASLSTSKFKYEYKYKNWFKQKKKFFENSYPLMLKAFNESSDLGIHPNIERKKLTQSLEVNEKEKYFKIDAKFHDISTEKYSYDVTPAIIYNLHQVFYTMAIFLYNENTFPAKLDDLKK